MPTSWRQLAPDLKERNDLGVRKVRESDWIGMGLMATKWGLILGRAYKSNVGPLGRACLAASQRILIWLRVIMKVEVKSSGYDE